MVLAHAKFSKVIETHHGLVLDMRVKNPLKIVVISSAKCSTTVGNTDFFHVQSSRPSDGSSSLEYKWAHL